MWYGNQRQKTCNVVSVTLVVSVTRTINRPNLKQWSIYPLHLLFILASHENTQYIQICFCQVGSVSVKKKVMAKYTAFNNCRNIKSIISVTKWDTGAHVLVLCHQLMLETRKLWVFIFYSIMYMLSGDGESCHGHYKFLIYCHMHCQLPCIPHATMYQLNYDCLNMFQSVSFNTPQFFSLYCSRFY